MEMSTIQSLLTKQHVIVEEKRVLLKRLYEDHTNDLTAMIKAMGFEQCQVSWEPERTKFMMPKPDSSWTYDIDIYTYAKYKTYEDGEVPEVTPKLSWSSSDATAADTEILEYLKLLGVLANDLKDGGPVVNGILARISMLKQYKHDLGWSEALKTESDLERAYKEAEDAKKDEEALDVIREGAEFLVLKNFSQGRRFYANKDNALKITKVGRKNLHVKNGWKNMYRKERNMDIDWSYEDTYLSIETLKFYIKEGYLLPC